MKERAMKCSLERTSSGDQSADKSRWKIKSVAISVRSKSQYVRFKSNAKRVGKSDKCSVWASEMDQSSLKPVPTEGPWK